MGPGSSWPVGGEEARPAGPISGPQIDGESSKSQKGPAGLASSPPNGSLLLGTHRDIWASEVTERNPALHFLIPAQRLELAKEDAKRLELEHGQPVTVSANGASVEAQVAIRERLRQGAAFLIEGTREDNANLLANGAPRTVEVRPAATPDIPPATGKGMAE
jgi:anaerobic selenocysteine-containing dehydrogenase